MLKNANNDLQESSEMRVNSTAPRISHKSHSKFRIAQLIHITNIPIFQV